MFRVIVQIDKADHYLTTAGIYAPVADCVPHGDEVAEHEAKEFRTMEGAVSAYYGTGSQHPGIVYNAQTKVKHIIA